MLNRIDAGDTWDSYGWITPVAAFALLATIFVTAPQTPAATTAGGPVSDMDVLTISGNYQNREIDTSQPAVPDTVSVALAELAGELREGLLALAVGTGLQVMAAIMEADVTAAGGPKGRHDPERTATRHGHGAGSVSLGGRRVPVQRPRMRAVDGSGELPVPAYELFSDTEVLGRIALDRMLAGLSTRHYSVGLEPVGARTEKAPGNLALGRVAPVRRPDPDRPGRVARRGPVLPGSRGVHGRRGALRRAHLRGRSGINIDGAKHPLSLVEGSTENTTLVTALIVGLRERGLKLTRPILAVLDGSKALRRAVLDAFDRPVIGRCPLHKICECRCGAPGWRTTRLGVGDPA